jgi:Uroporphyrinogen decarboxylase (URO-D).
MKRSGNMKHRDRVLSALHHEAPDRCPMQISFTPEFAARLKRGIFTADKISATGNTGHNPHGGGNTYELERFLDQDLILTSVGWANSYYHEGASYTDEWGIGWRATEYATKYGKGTYTEITGHPLANDEAIDTYKCPDPNRPELYTEAAETIRNYKNEYFIVGVTVTTIFEAAWALRGLDQLMMDFILNPDLAEKILDIPYHYHLTAACKLVALGVDMIWIGDDVGTQKTMMISPALWRQFFKPRMANFIATLKRMNPNVKVAYHSDGVINPIIPDLIEIGLDVLNPVQPACMDPAKLKKEYGRELCFWGTIDEQYTLPFGNPGEVRQEVIERIQTIGENGGLIIGPTHHVQLDTSMENFWSLVNTIRETSYASLK